MGVLVLGAIAVRMESGAGELRGDVLSFAACEGDACIRPAQMQIIPCVGEGCASCSDDAQCSAGGRCVGGACTFCALDIDCASGERCVRGQCLEHGAIARLPSFCGNARVDGGEECDDGSANADVANARCRRDCTLAGCGDGVLDDARERCDDGNRIDGDGCSALCQGETARPTSTVSAQLTDLLFASDDPAESRVLSEGSSGGPLAIAAMFVIVLAGYRWSRRG